MVNALKYFLTIIITNVWYKAKWHISVIGGPILLLRRSNSNRSNNLFIPLVVPLLHNSPHNLERHPIFSPFKFGLFIYRRNGKKCPVKDEALPVLSSGLPDRRDLFGIARSAKFLSHRVTKNMTKTLSK